MEAKTRVDAVKHVLHASSALLSHQNPDEWAADDPQIVAADAAIKDSFKFNTKQHRGLGPDIPTAFSLGLIKDPQSRLDRLSLAIHLFSQPTRSEFTSVLYTALLMYVGREDPQLSDMSYTQLVKYADDRALPQGILGFMENAVDWVTAAHGTQGAEVRAKAATQFLDGVWEHAKTAIHELLQQFQEEEAALRQEEAEDADDLQAISSAIGIPLQSVRSFGDLSAMLAGAAKQARATSREPHETRAAITPAVAAQRIDAAADACDHPSIDNYDDWVIRVEGTDTSFSLMHEVINNGMTFDELVLLFEDKCIQLKKAKA